ncbi:M24 family metallopeptidase, partial [Mycolicibacterium elephantis]
VTGAPQLWVAGTRPFGPICEVLRSTGEIYLNSTWDEGIPDEIPHENLYGLAWNPMTLVEVLKALPGATAVKRVGTDALTPTFAQLLPMAFPNAELVDAEPALRAARRIKTPAEVAVLRGALSVAETALDTARAELRAGVSEQSLTGALMEAMAAGGVSTPATQDGAWATSKQHPWQRARSGGQIENGDLVAFSAGVLADGYLGEVGRTWPVGDVDGS